MVFLCPSFLVHELICIKKLIYKFSINTATDHFFSYLSDLCFKSHPSFLGAIYDELCIKTRCNFVDMNIANARSKPRETCSSLL